METDSVSTGSSQQFIGTRVDSDIAMTFEGIAADNRRSKSEELRIAIERHIAAEQDARERSAA